MKKFFTLCAALLMSALSFADSGTVQNIPTTDSNPFDCSTVVLEQVSYPDNAGWNGNNIDWIGHGDVVSYNINNTVESAYKITFTYSTILEGVTVDFVIKDASDKEVFKSTIETPCTSGGLNDWSNYVAAESAVTPVLPTGAYKFYIYYGEGTWQGEANYFACNINNIKFEAVAGGAAGASFDIDLSTVDTSESKAGNLHYMADGDENCPRLDYPGAGSIAKFEIDIPETSAYKIAFNYASPMDKMFMVWTLTNAAGELVYNEYFPLEPTGAPGDFWTIYKDFDGVPTTPVLAAGKYTLRIYYNVSVDGEVTPAWYDGNENAAFHSNIKSITFTAVAGGETGGVADAALDATTLDEGNSTSAIWLFADGYIISNTANKSAAAGSVNTLKYSRNTTFTIEVPAGKTVTAVEFEGYTNGTWADGSYSFVGVLGDQTFNEKTDDKTLEWMANRTAKYGFPGNDETNDDGTQKVATHKIDLASPVEGGGKIDFAFYGTNQVCAIVRLYTGGGAAQEAKVIYSWIGAEAGATEVGGKAVASDGESVNYLNAGGDGTEYYTIRINKKKADIATDNVEFTLDEPLQAGDEIAITGYRNKDTDANGNLYILFENGTEIDEGEDVKWNNVHADYGQKPNTNTYAVGDAAGSKSFKIARSKASTNVFITEIKITRGGATGIESVKAVKVIPVNNFIYNLAGQRVDANYKGVVIKNGKKFLQK